MANVPFPYESVLEQAAHLACELQIPCLPHVPWVSKYLFRLFGPPNAVPRRLPNGTMSPFGLGARLWVDDHGGGPVCVTYPVQLVAGSKPGEWSIR